MGQRRSGTSAVAGIVHKLGMPMQEGEIHTSERNPKGFFEDRNIISISERILGAIAKGGTAAQIDHAFRGEIKKALKKVEDRKGGFKDVNQVLTHTFFKKYIKEAKYIFVFRNVLDIANSFYDWQKNNQEISFMDALKEAVYNNDMLFSRVVETKEPMLLTSFDKFLKKPDELVDKIIKFLEITPTEEQRQEAIKHIDPTLTTI